MRIDDGNLRSNMFIYKLATQQGDEGSAIVMHEDGDLGQYNRANRSVHHFMESSLSLVAALPLSFFLFAFPTFVALCCFCVGRIIYQIGYTAKGYGGHVIGWIIDTFANMTIAGLMILAYQKSFSIDTTI